MMLILAGVSGSGKTTVGTVIAQRLHWRFADADEFHPAANIEKMRAGIPLTDEDRWPWLQAIGAWMDARAADGESAVIACSALRRRYRDMLLRGRPAARIVVLTADPALLARRVTARPGHFFPGRLLGSQLATLEPPRPDEPAVTAVRADQPAGAVADAIMALLLPGERARDGAGGGDEAQA
jgi:gluconokinase